MKVSCIGGAGRIGSNCATLIANHYDCNIIIAGRESDPCEGISYEIANSVAISNKNSTFDFVRNENEYSKIKDSDVVIITAGMPRTKDMKSRDELTNINSVIIKSLAKKIDELCPNTFVIVVTNPLDLMCSVFKNESKRIKQNKIVGMAGILDSARLKYIIAKEFNIDQRYVSALVLGEHGESMVCALSQCTIYGIPFYEFIKEKNISNEKILEIQDSVVKFGSKINNLTGQSAAIAPAFGVFEIFKSYIEDSKKVIPCSVFVNGEYGLKDVFFGCESVIGSGGVEKIIESKLTENEKKLLTISYNKVLENTKKLS